MNLTDLYGEEPIVEARRVWARRGKKVVQKFRCTSGWRKGRLVATAASCSKPIDMKKRFTLRKTKARLGKRIARKTARAKRFNPITKRITQMNKSTRPKTPGRKKGGVKWWHRT